MLTFHPVRLEDKAFLNQYLKNIPPHLIEHSFNTLFPWQGPHHYQWAAAGKWLFLQTTYQKKTSFFPPIAKEPFQLEEFTGALQQVLDYCRTVQLPCCFTEVGEAEMAMMHRAMPGFFATQTDRNNANYIYRVDDLVRLAGKKYHQKKNHLNSFKRNYPYYEFLPLTTQMVEPCKETLTRWCQENNCTAFPTLVQESQAIHILLEHLGDLDYFGACIAIGGRVEAFTIGEILNENTVAILSDKANAGFQGLYTAINQMFLAEYWQDFTYVNRAEDLGLANLRKTKLSYYPCHLEMKYILKPLNQRKLRPSAAEGV